MLFNWANLAVSESHNVVAITAVKTKLNNVDIDCDNERQINRRKLPDFILKSAKENV